MEVGVLLLLKVVLLALLQQLLRSLRQLLPLLPLPPSRPRLQYHHHLLCAAHHLHRVMYLFVVMGILKGNTVGWTTEWTRCCLISLR